MSIFALKRIELIRAKQETEKLLINGQCQFDEFIKLVEKDNRNRKEFGTLIRYMEIIANGEIVPKKHFRDITPDGQIVKEYEFKSKHLRVYAIKKDGGKIVILGGFKTTQKKDINKFRGIKKAYLDSIKNNSHE